MLKIEFAWIAVLRGTGIVARQKCIKCGSENTTDEIDDYNCKMDDYQLLYNISHDGNFILQMLRLKIMIQ